MNSVSAPCGTARLLAQTTMGPGGFIGIMQGIYRQGDIGGERERERERHRERCIWA